MPTRHGWFTRTAAALSRSPLGVLALCLVFVYSVVSAAFGVGAAHLGEGQRWVLVLFLVLYPVLVLGVLYRLVSLHYPRLFGPSDFREEQHFVELVRPERGGSPAAAPSHSGPALTPVSPPLQIGAVVEGDDFMLFTAAPAANAGPRPNPGFYTAATGDYCVTKRHIPFRLRSPDGRSELTRVDALPPDSRPVPSQHCDRALHVLAEAAEVIAS